MTEPADREWLVTSDERVIRPLTERVLLGFGQVSNAPPCPYCGDSHYAIVDDGDPTSVRVDCWCGAHARCQRDDPDLVMSLRLRMLR